MFPEPFKLERFFARHEFTARYLLSTSDCQGLAMADLLAGASTDLRDRWDHLHLGYTESQGLPELRSEIAAMYEAVVPEEVLVAAPEELIFLTMNALLRSGDHVICTFPGYQSLYELAISIGCEVSLWKPVEGDLWRFDPDDLKRLLRLETRLVVWNFPHNPTGALPSRDDYKKMLDLVRESGAWLFGDEMYRLLEPVDDVRLPAAVDRSGRAISLSGMSKSFALAGLRIGWAATHDLDLLERMKGLKDYTTICSSAPSELLALMGLKARHEILKHNRELVRRNVELAGAAFERLHGVFSWIPPQGGTVCFPRLAEGLAHAAGGAEAFCARVLADTGVLLLPSTAYGYGDNHVRVGLGREDFAEGLRVLEEYHSRGH
jgi:aspartate/methionine/tyrosine aminotransferase